MGKPEARLRRLPVLAPGASPVAAAAPLVAVGALALAAGLAPENAALLRKRDELQAKLDGIVWNDPASYKGQIREILANASIFGTDLTKTSLADKVEAYFVKLLGGVGAARALLQTELPA